MIERLRDAALCCLAWIFLIVGPAAAQTTAEVIPANPTSADAVIVRVTDPSIIDDDDVTRIGNHFVIDVAACHMTCVPVGTANVHLGFLAAGNYTYDVSIEGTFALSGSFVVAQQALADTPTLSPVVLLALCLILGAAGWTLLGRRT
jgi:hypothetical protein